MRIGADELAGALGAELMPSPVGDGSRYGGDRLDVAGLAIDSRLVRPGQLFVALRAERDGHDFVDDAFLAGAAASLVDRVPTGGARGALLVVEHVPDALAELARIARERLSGGERVIGVTGSVGKTTTKDLLANVLRRRFRTVASERSFNNELGVPLTLFNAPEGTEAAVIEMGARGTGHIRHLCELARPTVGVVTVVEGVHTEVMGPIGQIAVAKRELVESLPTAGAAVLNADDPNVAAMAAHATATVLTFSAAPPVGASGRDGDLGEVRAERIELDDELRASFVLRSSWGTIPLRLGVRGRHNVTNALAAATTGLWLGMGLDEVAEGLADPPVSPWRMELVRVQDGHVVINDAYNAGPASMRAALEALAALPTPGRRVAVLGVMAELGSEGPDEHRRIAELAGRLDIDVVAVDCDLYGRPPSVELTSGDVEDVVRAVGRLGAGDAVLVKGSRVAGLERVAEALTRPGP